MPTLLIEHEYGRGNGTLIAGTDEAGRGPLAGPVVAAAVIIPAHVPDELAHGINDSKALTARKRALLFKAITAHCPYGIAEASVEEIDTINILEASLLAMRRAVEKLPQSCAVVLMDGNRRTDFGAGVKAVPIIKGDSKSLSIAAASILAKVHRDQIMHGLHESFPAYNWMNNAGYPTPDHRAALAAHGPCPHHRQSFAPVKAALARRA